MANEQNLIPQNKRTKSEQREIAKLGGKASVKSRRKKRYIKDLLESLMLLDVTDETLKTKMRSLGINEDDMTIQSGILCSLVNQALYRKFKGISINKRSIRTKS